MLNPFSKKREIASCRRSWKCKSLMFPFFFSLSQASLTALADIGKGSWVFSRMYKALLVRGIVRSSPFFVKRINKVCPLMCSCLMLRISPRLIAVSMASFNNVSKCLLRIVPFNKIGVFSFC